MMNTSSVVTLRECLCMDFPKQSYFPRHESFLGVLSSLDRTVYTFSIRAAMSS